jgi:hypothetical protein
MEVKKVDKSKVVESKRLKLSKSANLEHLFSVRKGVDESHEHPPGSATAGCGNLWGKAKHPIALIGASSSPPCGGRS